MSSAARLAASFDAIRERLFALPRQPQARGDALVAALMSRVGGEGVTTVAVGLARAVARAHTLRTLLIDYDAGARGAAAGLGVPAQAFAGWVAGAEAGARSIAEALIQVEPGRLDVLTLGPGVPSGFQADALWSEAFALLRSTYDLVLVDTGSTRNPQALRWARIADVRLLVLDTNRTTTEELERFKVEWRAADQTLDAVVLSKRDYHVPGFLYRHVR